ncbi:hypothetical protein Moror_8784 [Moniliophthora roreri MCA 2997]|uniref:Uncharacterized protein n=1 Tax=Moniliophthora roreri (strain MCA 2997) TaxID=1381753 RepID=V2XVB1_MONRO|nr:hypothetical protein Moror_8784 [Moniliophthora roreri MCA 2997]KAI3605025.1 hypothetical protein WG66_001936 [Moniliophthora roreri]
MFSIPTSSPGSPLTIMRFTASALFVILAATFVAANPLARRQDDIPCDFSDPEQPACPVNFICCGPEFICRDVEVCAV